MTSVEEVILSLVFVCLFVSRMTQKTTRVGRCQIHCLPLPLISSLALLFILFHLHWHCWLGDRKGIQPVKHWMLVCCWWWFDWSFARLTGIAPVVTTTSIILCFSKHRLTQVHVEMAVKMKRFCLFFTWVDFICLWILMNLIWFDPNCAVV